MPVTSSLVYKTRTTSPPSANSMQQLCIAHKSSAPRRVQPRPSHVALLLLPLLMLSIPCNYGWSNTFRIEIKTRHTACSSSSSRRPVLTPDASLCHRSQLRAQRERQQRLLHAKQSHLHALQSNLHTKQSHLHALQSNLHTKQSHLHALQSNLHTKQSHLHTLQSCRTHVTMSRRRRLRCRARPTPL